MLHIRSKIVRTLLAAVFFLGMVFVPAIGFSTQIKAPGQQHSSPVIIKTAKAYTPGDISLTTDVLAQQNAKGKWVKELFDFSKGLLNVVLFLILVYIAFLNILNRDMNTYAVKAILPKIIGVAVAANLALPIFAIVSRAIDSLQVVSLFKPTGFDWLYIVSAGGDFWKDASIWVLIGIIGTVVAGGISGIGCLIVGAIVFGAIIIVILLSLILAFRPYVVFLCAAVSPLAIGCYILPQTKGFFDKWIKVAWPWLIMPIPVYFIINVGYKIPTDMTSVGGGAIATILGIFLPALLRAGLLILAIRFPFMIEKDITGGIAKLGGMVGGMAKSGIGGVGAWEDQALWPKKWKTSQNGTKRFLGNLAQGTGKLVNRPVTSAAGWAGYLGGGTTAQRKARAVQFQNATGVRIAADYLPSLIRLTVIPETIKDKKEQNASLIQDAIDENSQASGIWEDEKSRTKRLREAYKTREEDKEYEVLNENIEVTLREPAPGGGQRDAFMFDRMNNLSEKQLQTYLTKTMQKRIFDEEFNRLRPTLPATTSDREVSRQVGANAGVRARMDAERTRIRTIADTGGRDGLYTEMTAVVSPNVTTALDPAAQAEIRMSLVSAFMDEMATTTSNGKLTLGGQAVDFAGLSKADFDLMIARVRTAKRKSSRQFEPIGFEDIRGRTRGEAVDMRQRRAFAGGDDDDGAGGEAGGDMGGGDGRHESSSGKTSSPQIIQVKPGDLQTNMGVISANQNIASVMARSSGDTNLSVETIRRMAKTMKLEGAFSDAGAGDSATSASIIASRLEKVMSPDRFASFAGAMAGGDDTTINNVMQGAKGNEQALLHASVSAKEIATADALDSGEAQNVAVYATRIAPRFASIRNNQQQITDLKGSAEAIITHEANEAFNANQPAGAQPRETLTAEALEPHKRVIAQMIGTSADTVDGKSAQFFLRATDALQVATSNPKVQTQQQQPPAPTAQTQQQPPAASAGQAPTAQTPDQTTPAPVAPTTPNNNEG